MESPCSGRGQDVQSLSPPWAQVLYFPRFIAMRERVTVKVPATTGNMGPGFDCLGMALDIWNAVEVEVGPPSFNIVGEGETTLPRQESNLVHRCFRVPFEEAGEPVPKVSITCRNNIPLGRGLGSSSAAVVGGLVAGNELCGKPLSQERLLELATELEGHADNVAPALLGGCQIVVREDDRLVSVPVPLPEDLRVVLFIPDSPMPTREARQALPSDVPMEDAVYNMGRVALLVRALSTGDLTHLAIATGDRLHQPARQTIFPAMKHLIRAALGAGALGAFLSGAGSTVLALAREREMTIGYEMADAAVKLALDGTMKVSRPTNLGAHLVEDE